MGYTEYKEEYITPDDVKRLNIEEMERVEGAASLYESLMQALDDDTYNLGKQIYRKYFFRKDSLHTEIRFTDTRLNRLAYRLKRKYSDEFVETHSIHVGGQKLAASMLKEQFEPSEIDNLLATYITNFHRKTFYVDDELEINVPSVHLFKIKNNDEFSSNKLINYIVEGNKNKNAEKVGAFESNVILQLLENRLGTKRHMKNGKSTKVNLNDIEIMSYEDIETPEDSNGNQMLTDELFGKIDHEDADIYQPTIEFAFIKSNYRSVLTNNQIGKLDLLVDLIEKGEIQVSDLFHDVTNTLILERLGEIWYPGKDNNYIQPAVKNVLESVRRRMNAAIEKQGFDSKNNIRSDYRKLKDHSIEDNKLLKVYGIYDKFLIRDLHVDPFHNEIDVTIKNDEQFIPYAEYERIEKNETTIKGVIQKYQLTKKDTTNQNGIVKHYVLSDKGEPLFTDKEIYERIEKHCRQLIDWIREGSITFTKYDNTDGYMKPNSHKLHSMTFDDYYKLVERPLATMDDKKELEIVKKYMIEDSFNTENKYILKDSYYVDTKENKYINQRDYDPSKENDTKFAM